MNKTKVLTPQERIGKKPDKLFLFRSCTGSIGYPGTESAVREVLIKLGIDVITDPDQTCCSGAVAGYSGYPPEASLAVTARNFAMVEKKYDADTYCFCNGCFVHISHYMHDLQTDPDKMANANAIINQWGYDYKARNNFYHVQELYYLLLDEIRALVVRPLNGLRVGCHYGCAYLLKKYGIVDDHELPTFHEQIITALGGVPVFYKERRSCCGSGAGRGFTHKESVVHPHLVRKLDSAKEEGVQLMTTVCPGCNMALDAEQPVLAAQGYGPYDIPVIDLAQLIGLAIGVDPKILGFTANTVSLQGVLEQVGLGKGA
ncbi:MAG: CoB--CoM heterodisulfide reductase iron-sulfur subunit B family protein [Syntrophomonas sp.]|nr:CoB--CoM heterodisulfide reductase iron-sulfur subunit B family protein [Syntrophomonas sp.]